MAPLADLFDRQVGDYGQVVAGYLRDLIGQSFGESLLFGPRGAEQGGGLVVGHLFEVGQRDLHLPVGKLGVWLSAELLCG